MSTSFANRLAAGGIWAIFFADRMRLFSEHLRENGIGPLPIKDGSPYAVFNYAGRDAFNWIAQGYIPKGHRAHVDMELIQPKFYCRNGTQISQELWQQHLSDENYRVVAHSCNPVRKVSVVTFWIGVDIAGTQQVFRTLVFQSRGAHNGATHYVAASTEQEARQVHQALVNAIQSGKL